MTEHLFIAHAVKDMNFQLGYYVGEYILHHFLPSLSIYDEQTRNVIQCTIGETEEYHRLDKIWFDSYEHNHLKRDSKYENKRPEWLELRAYANMLEKKHLPDILRCYLPRVTPTDMDVFLNGFIDSLWNSDVCNYSLDKKNIEFTQEEYKTIINLKLSVK